MPAELTKQDTPYGWYVAVVMCLCFTFSYMDRSVVPLLVQPLERSLHMSDTTIALLQGAAFATFYVLFGFPLARFADNGHRRNLIIAGLVVWSIATIGCGLANSVWQLFVGRMCVAAGEAVLAPAAVSILSDYFTVARRGRAISIYSMGVFFGGGLSLWLGGSLIHALGPFGILATPIGPLETWRVVFIVLGISSIVLIPLLLTVREPARRSDKGESQETKTSMREVLAVFKTRRGALFACVVGFALLSLGAQTLTTWAPTLFVRVHGWKLAGTGQKLGLITLVLSPLGVITGSLLADFLERSGRRDGKLLVGLISALGCILASFTATLSGEAIALVGLAALQFTVAFNFGLVHAALSEILPNRMRAFGAACYTAMANILSATLGPLLVGVFNDTVYHNPNMIALSIRWVSPTAFVIAAFVLIFGLKPFRMATRHLIATPVD